MAECSDSSVTNNTNLQKQKGVPVQTPNDDENMNDKAMDPLLIEDIIDQEYPLSFKILQEELKHRQINPSVIDLVPLFVHLLMLEEGFVPNFGSYDGYHSSYNAKQVINLAAKFPINWKRSDQHYEMDFVIARYPLFLCKIICVVNMGSIIINALIKGIPNAKYSMMVDPKMYFLNTKRFQNIRKFAVSFKNGIGYPARLDVLRRNNVVTPSLQDLPDELIFYIKKFVKTPNFDKAILI